MINGDLFEWGVGSGECGVVVEILRISNKIESRRDLHRHSQLPTPNSKLLDKFQFVEASEPFPIPNLYLPPVDVFWEFWYN